MQYQLPFPATEPPCDITSAIEAITVMRCPFCGSDWVLNLTPDGWIDETWLCFGCGLEFDGWDHIPHPQQAAWSAASRRPGAGAGGEDAAAVASLQRAGTGGDV